MKDTEKEKEGKLVTSTDGVPKTNVIVPEAKQAATGQRIEVADGPEETFKTPKKGEIETAADENESQDKEKTSDNESPSEQMDLPDDLSLEDDQNSDEKEVNSEKDADISFEEEDEQLHQLNRKLFEKDEDEKVDETVEDDMTKDAVATNEKVIPEITDEDNDQFAGGKESKERKTLRFEAGTKEATDNFVTDEYDQDYDEDEIIPLSERLEEDEVSDNDDSEDDFEDELHGR